jgi:hypothetical protein
MKKYVIALVLAGGVGAIAYASLSSNKSTKQSIEKKTDKQEKKKECKHSCMFS